MRGEKKQKIITLIIVIFLIVPSISCKSLNQDNEEQLTIKNPLSPQMATEIVVDENVLVILLNSVNYIFDITNKENPRKKAALDLYPRTFLKNFIYKNKLLSYTKHYDETSNPKYELMIFDITKIRHPKIVKRIPLDRNLSYSFINYIMFGEEDEITLYQLEKNGTEIHNEKINLLTYEYQLQTITAETIFEEEGNLWSIKKRENKAYVTFTDENGTLGVGIFSIEENKQLVKEKIMKSNDKESLNNLECIIDENCIGIKAYSIDFESRSRQTVYDLTNEDELIKIDNTNFEDIGEIQKIENNLLYTIEKANFRIYDISDWENIELIGTCNSEMYLYKTLINGKYVYVNRMSYFRTDFMAIIDMTSMEVVKIFGTQLIKQETKLTIMMAASWTGLITGIVTIIVLPIVIVRRRKKIIGKIKLTLGDEENSKRKGNKRSETKRIKKREKRD